MPWAPPCSLWAHRVASPAVTHRRTNPAIPAKHRLAGPAAAWVRGGAEEAAYVQDHEFAGFDLRGAREKERAQPEDRRPALTARAAFCLAARPWGPRPRRPRRPRRRRRLPRWLPRRLPR